tara:strand:+ start:9336 stop:10415 length:1080 start_codon:yes stop_codon:yes gene_type:complete
MPINYEPIDATTDVATTRTLLHEVIPLTGTIVSGTYGTFPSDENIKNYSHGMFQSVYDYPFLSSSANHIFDLTVGYDETSPRSGSASLQNSKKINMYNQMSQVLLGYTGSANEVRRFESDLTLDGAGAMKETIFVNFSRLLSKDEIKKGSFSITVKTGSYFGTAPSYITGGMATYTDSAASETQGTLNTVGGDYGILSGAQGIGGVVFYQAGLAVLTASIFRSGSAVPSSRETPGFYSDGGTTWHTVDELLTGSTISGACDAVRQRIDNIQFNNTTEINSTVYFCRMPHNKYNYSSNPTYLNNGAIRVKNENRNNPPVAYITTIGLYNSANELLAVAKLSEPLRKDPTNELTLRVRLDY